MTVPWPLRTCLLLLSVGALCPAAGAAEWAVASATHRYALTPARANGIPASVGRVVLWPQDDTEREVLITAADGRPVGCQVLWSAPGQPLEVLFDGQAGASGVAYVGAGLPKPPAWEADAGLVMECRQRIDGTIATGEQIRALWNKASVVQGRCAVAQIFHGINPLGPSYDFIAKYHGSFVSAAPGTYQFATISDDGSVLFIDGKRVVDWPGWHGPEEGRGGQIHAEVSLTRGRHTIDYWVVQGTGGFCAQVAWKTPGQKDFAVMPTEAFGRVDEYTATKPETPAGPDPLAVTWAMTWHVSADIPGIAPTLVEATVRLLAPAEKTHATWRWDDGAVDDGNQSRHMLAASGLRQITVETKRGPTLLGRRTVPIAVQPCWTQAEDFPQEGWRKHRKELLTRDLSQAPASDLTALVDFAAAMDDIELETAIGLAALKRVPDMLGTQSATLLRLGFHFQHPAVRRYDDAVTILRACTRSNDAALAARAGLHLGGLLLHGRFDAPQAATAWDAVDAKRLSDEDRRLLTIYRADAQLLTGQVEAAKAAYQAIGTVVVRGDLAYAMRRRMRLEMARDHLSQGETDAAEETLRAIEWETPLERAGSETGLVLSQVWLRRGELAFALSRCRMILAVGDDPRAPEVLLTMVRIQLAGGETAQAKATAQRLRGEYPYSEAAARVPDLIAITDHKDAKP